MRSLPQVTGPTESALGALLARQLEPSRIPDYLTWVAINAAAAAPGRGEIEAAVEARTRCGSAAAADAVSRLVSLGLLDPGGRLTGDGDAELADTRERVAAATAAVTDGVAEAELATTIAVLDRVRRQAEELLAS